MISTTTTTAPTTPRLTHDDVPRCSPGMTFANRYAIEAEVGAGAEARVFSALDLGHMPPRRVAIKVSHERHRSKSRRYLNREAAQMQRLQAVIGIVHVVESEVCEHQGLTFVVREFVDGPSLRELFAMRGKLDAAEVIHIGRSLARTLAQSHAMGVQLRDLKPDNVILRGGSEPVIIDLGSATAAESATTGTDPTRALMTPAYASPEQLAGQNAGMASDIYALGVILCEMASGRLPLPGVVDLRGITRPIATIARACLAHEPAKRPTAAQLVNAFTAANVRWMSSMARGDVAVDPRHRGGWNCITSFPRWAARIGNAGFGATLPAIDCRGRGPSLLDRQQSSKSHAFGAWHEKSRMAHARRATRS